MKEEKKEYQAEVTDEKAGKSDEEGGLTTPIIVALLLAAVVLIAFFALTLSKSGERAPQAASLHLTDQGTSEESVLSDLPEGVTLTATDYQAPMLTLVLSNQSSETITYGEEYLIQKKDEEAGWLNVSPSKQYTWSEDSHELPAGQEVTVSYDLSVFGQLQPGEYRLVKAGICAPFNLEN